MASEEGDEPQTTVSPQRDSALPHCCDSGCIVCVLDYPELYMNRREALEPSDSQPSEMLDAIRLAQVLLDGLGAEKITSEPDIEGGR